MEAEAEMLKALSAIRERVGDRAPGLCDVTLWLHTVGLSSLRWTLFLRMDGSHDNTQVAAETFADLLRQVDEQLLPDAATREQLLAL